ncbi:hypothetical protein OGAPHI_003062 [Ogataea philodendri]|uniref:Uncharacterized protein n=1 Tax=Ogataea philodendri TaxID=1378263 RepID=A0A9P8T5V8_9ASCO|nr:uncharacterized protein OGAPHI_003062 [Ogataea philodendri]KAH3667413.1 hypothetical protein OGAPHI_003062 [Ogataea philodendri]
MFSDLELEYDQFNGSVTDLAEQPGNESMESMVGETTNETVESTEDVLVVPKQRDSDKYPLRIASHFTASKKVKSPEETHLDELSKMKGEFAKKAYKIGKEIAFLEVLVPQMEDGVELDKLKVPHEQQQVPVRAKAVDAVAGVCDRVVCKSIFCPVRSIRGVPGHQVHQGLVVDIRRLENGARVELVVKQPAQLAQVELAFHRHDKEKKTKREFSEKKCADSEDRTQDLQIFSLTLSQLS